MTVRFVPPSGLLSRGDIHLGRCPGLKLGRPVEAPVRDCAYGEPAPASPKFFSVKFILLLVYPLNGIARAEGFPGYRTVTKLDACERGAGIYRGQPQGEKNEKLCSSMGPRGYR